MFCCRHCTTCSARRPTRSADFCFLSLCCPLHPSLNVPNCHLLPAADFNAEPVFPSEWRPGLPIKLPGQASFTHTAGCCCTRAASFLPPLPASTLSLACDRGVAGTGRGQGAWQPARGGAVGGTLTQAVLLLHRVYVLLLHRVMCFYCIVLCVLIASCLLQTRVSPEEYKEFLSLGHGEIFSLDLDSVVDAPWR